MITGKEMALLILSMIMMTVTMMMMMLMMTMMTVTMMMIMMTSTLMMATIMVFVCPHNCLVPDIGPYPTFIAIHCRLYKD